jgi:uncharacterized cupredoxin-like copper-binding protein
MTLRTFSLILSLSLTTALALAHDGDKEGEDFGQPGNPLEINRTVKIEMRDSMRFSPDKLKVKKGDTVLFVIHNAGALKHELVLGTDKELKAHNEFMKQNPDMEHDDDSMVSVAPGDTAEIIWKFSRSGAVSFACLQPGHYAAGMKGSVSVVGTEHKHSSTKH